MVDQVIKLKRNTANTNAPDTGDIVVGELAIGAVAGKLYLRKSDDSILTFSDDSNVSTTLTIAADSGSNDTVTVGTNTLTFNGTSNQIGTTVSDNAITIALADNPVIGGTGSIRVPDGTTGQRPGSPAAGMFRYNTTTSKFEGYTDDWGDIGGGGANTFTRNAYTGDGSTTAFTLSQTVNSENDLIVFIEGVFQDQDAYSVSGTTLTFDTAPVNGRGIIVYSVKHTVAGSNLNIDTMTGDGSDTTLSLTISPNDENNTQVFIDGVYQNKSTYSISGSTLTFSTAPPNGSAVECMTFTQTDVNEATYVTANANNSTNETVYPVFVDGATGKQEIETDTGLTYNPSTGNLTIGGALTAATLDISGDIDIDGTLEADAITVNGTTLSETIADTVGAMVSSNTESGITVAYQDADNTLDFTVGTLNQDTTGTAAIATTVTITDNESTNEENAVVFTAGGDVDGGNLGLESDGNLTYNPSSGTLTATAFVGALTGNVTGNASGTAATVTGAAQSAITSLGTLTSLTGGTGDFNWDSGTLFIDSSANAIGIGNTSPKEWHSGWENLQIGERAAFYSQASGTTGIAENIYYNSGFKAIANDVSSAYQQDSGNHHFYTGASVSADAAVTLTERLTVLNSGNVGIGTASPDVKLEIAETASDTGVQLKLNGNRSSNGNVGDIVFENNSDSVAMIRASRVGGNNDAADMLFYTQATGGSNTERARITSDGSLLVGNDTDTQSILGRTAIGFVSGLSDYAYIGHLDVADSGGYALLQSSAGATFLNAEDGQDIRFLNHGTTSMTLDDSGKLGIGTTSPLSHLTFESDHWNTGTETGPSIRWNNGITTADSIIQNFEDANVAPFFIGMNSFIGSGGSVAAFNTSYASSYIYQGATGNIQFGNNSSGTTTARMTIKVDGKVGIGSSTPSYKNLTINSASGDAGYTFEVGGTRYWNATVDTAGSPGSNAYWIGDAEDDNGVYVGQGGSSWSGISDERLKRNWTNITNATDKIKTLTKVGTFERRGKTTGNWSTDKEVGLSAQEVEAIQPEAVTTGGDIEFASDDKVTGVKGLSYEKLVPLLVKSIQELEARIKTLEEA